MQLKTLLGVISIIAICLTSSQVFAKQEFKKVIKDGKVLYLPVKAATKEKANSSEAEKPSEPIKKAKVPGEVVLFESNECAECRRIRRFFYSNKIEYIRKNIDLNKKFKFQLAQKTATNITPVLYVGEKRLTNLSTKNLKEYFDIADKKALQKQRKEVKKTDTSPSDKKNTKPSKKLRG